MFKTFTATPAEPVELLYLFKSTAQNTKQQVSRSHKITVRILDNLRIFCTCTLLLSRSTWSKWAGH